MTVQTSKTGRIWQAARARDSFTPAALADAAACSGSAAYKCCSLWHRAGLLNRAAGNLAHYSWASDAARQQPTPPTLGTDPGLNAAERVGRLLRGMRSATADELRALSGLSRTALHRVLRALVRHGLAACQRTALRRPTRYIWTATSPVRLHLDRHDRLRVDTVVLDPPARPSTEEPRHAA